MIPGLVEELEVVAQEFLPTEYDGEDVAHALSTLTHMNSRLDEYQPQ